MTEIVSLNGLRCRPKIAGRPAVMEKFYYTVQASFLKDDGMIMCALISTGGATNILPFLSLEFEPTKEE